MHAVTVRGSILSYAEAGSGPVVLFLHPLAFDHRLWKGQVAALSPRWRCVLLDLRGHGGSSSAPDGTTLEAEAEVVSDFLRGIAAGPAHLAGLSMGGMIALRLALDHPGQVRSLALLAASAEAEIAIRRRIFEGIATRGRDKGQAVVADEVFPHLLGPGFAAADPDGVASCRRIFLEADPAANLPMALAAARRTSVLSRLGEIRVPTLLLAGGEDGIAPPWRSRKMARSIPGARLHVLPGAGHLLAVERAGEVSELLAAFLDEAERQRPAGDRM